MPTVLPRTLAANTTIAMISPMTSTAIPRLPRRDHWLDQCPLLVGHVGVVAGTLAHPASAARVRAALPAGTVRSAG
jgi:hypothetical protein